MWARRWYILLHSRSARPHCTCGSLNYDLQVKQWALSIADLLIPHRDEEKSNKLIHTEQALADSHFHWISQDGQTDLPFSRDAAAALDLATQYDLCITGTGLTHLHNINADAAYIPLTQVILQPIYPPLSSGSHGGGSLNPTTHSPDTSVSHVTRIGLPWRCG